ncbi:D-amino-acid transaminase, partial [Gammaproteobacteria bacterium]|nr:D-amino-acid transaminase [Gammaproteobacteria bacterium]
EVVSVMDGKLIDFAGHMSRLRRSLGELNIPEPLTEAELLAVIRNLVQANDLDEGIVYMEITRGTAERDFVYSDNLKPTIVMFHQVKSLVENKANRDGVKLISMPDLRWARRDIKSVGLLAQVMAKQAASQGGAYEALMIKEGHVTEGGSSSAYIVKDNVVVTHPLSNDILPGITRASLLSLAADNEIEIDERAFTLEEAYDADEAFITAASTYVCPVVAIDDRPVGTGSVGPFVRKLQKVYLQHARSTAI